MRYQSRKSSCGPAALANALESIGIERTEDELATLSKQSVDGTSSSNLRKAAEAVGVETFGICEQRIETAKWALEYHLRSGNPAILVVDNDEHWVAVTGMLGDRVIVVDSADNDLLVYYTVARLLFRWCGPSKRFTGFFLLTKDETI